MKKGKNDSCFEVRTFVRFACKENKSFSSMSDCEHMCGFGDENREIVWIMLRGNEM